MHPTWLVHPQPQLQQDLLIFIPTAFIQDTQIHGLTFTHPSSLLSLPPQPVTSFDPGYYTSSSASSFDANPLPATVVSGVPPFLPHLAMS